MKYTIDQLQDLMDKNHSTRQKFLMHILTIAATMLAVLTSFQKADSLTTVQHVLFVTSLALLLLGILSGGIVLYFDTVAAKSLFLQMKKELQKQLSYSETKPDNVIYNPPRIFYICEKACYLSLLTAVISIATYGMMF